MRQIRRIAATTLLVAVTASGSGCAPAPRQRPVLMGPVDTGEGSLEAARRELEGAWSLTSLEVMDGAGARRAVKANGVLSFDTFGNLTISGRIDDPRMESAIPLAFTGRIVIDPAKHVYYPADVEADTSQPVDTGRLAPVALDKVRQYSVTGGTLVVTYLDSLGKPTAVATWRRTSDR